MDEHYLLLIISDLKGTITEDEKIQLNNWLAETEKNRAECEYVINTWMKSGSAASLIQLDLKKDWDVVKEKIHPKKSMSLAWRSVAASIAILVAIGLFQFYITNSKEIQIASTSFESSAEIQEILLQDGSKVWLNRNSKIRIDDDFNTENRTVEIFGEGYFEIAEDTTKPFFVLTADSKTEVVGTVFNISTAENETTIHVEHGTVKFGGVLNELLLHHDMAAVLNPNGWANEIEADPNAIAWKTGKLVFKNESLTNVISEIQHFYQQDIIAKNDFSPLQLTSSFDNVPIELVLDEICLIHNLDYRTTVNGFELFKK